MSTYLDTRSGKWFNTRAELLAFQRGEGLPSPLLVSSASKSAQVETTKEVEVPSEEETPEEPVTEEQDAPEKTRSKKVETEEEKEERAFQEAVKHAMFRPMDEVRVELKERYGVDGRTLRYATEEDLKNLYIERVKVAWKTNNGKLR